MLRPIKKKRLAEDAAKQIQALIKGKKLKPGTRLPSERELMGEFNISRASVREALRILEITGQIDVKPGSGIYVREMRGDIFLPLTSWLPDHKETLQNHFEARQVLEPRAASFAAQRASNKIIKSMKKTLSDFKEKMERNDLVGTIMADVEFHRLISQATGNKTLMLLMDTIARYLLEGWKATLRVPDRMNKTIGEHEAILNAIEQREPDRAYQTMHQHLKNALQDLRRSGLE